MTKFYVCKTCNGIIHQSHVLSSNPEGTDHLVHMDRKDWIGNVHRAEIAPGVDWRTVNV